MTFSHWVALYVSALLTLVTVALLMRQSAQDRQSRRDRERERQREYAEDLYRSFSSEDKVGYVIAEDPEAHTLRFTFDIGPRLALGEVRREISGALSLVNDLARNNDVEFVAVRQLTYRNPLELLLLIWGTEAAISGIVGAAVGINAAVQRIRRSHSETKTIQADHRALESKHRTEEAIWDAVRAAIPSGQASDDHMQHLTSTAASLRRVEYLPPSSGSPELGTGRE